jgi:hypothetical protein
LQGSYQYCSTVLTSKLNYLTHTQGPIPPTARGYARANGV